MKQKDVEKSWSYSAQLYDLYGKGKEACSIFKVEIHRLVESIDTEVDIFTWSVETK